jgi:hypothetical protein
MEVIEDDVLVVESDSPWVGAGRWGHRHGRQAADVVGPAFAVAADGLGLARGGGAASAGLTAQARHPRIARTLSGGLDGGGGWGLHRRSRQAADVAGAAVAGAGHGRGLARGGGAADARFAAQARHPRIPGNFQAADVAGAAVAGAGHGRGLARGGGATNAHFAVQARLPGIANGSNLDVLDIEHGKGDHLMFARSLKARGMEKLLRLHHPERGHSTKITGGFIGTRQPG